MTFIIAIDGPSASGKGTLTKKVAERLGFDYLDTGMLYRTVAYHAIAQNTASDDIESILSLIDTIDFKKHLGVNLQDEKIGAMASKIGINPKVREKLNELQRTFPNGKAGAVIDGRDIGTVIFPSADVKFFITARVEIRAERRYKQLLSQGKKVTLEQVLSDLKERDARDRDRPVSPTLPALDAMIIDTSDLDPDSVVELVISHIKNHQRAANN
jgi:cytidylate kinase